MNIKPLFLIVHILNIMVAFITSVIQTRRIINISKRFNIPGLIILGGGLIAAVFGTFTIMNKIDKGLKDIEYLKNNIEKK